MANHKYNQKDKTIKHLLFSGSIISLILIFMIVVNLYFWPQLTEKFNNIIAPVYRYIDTRYQYIQTVWIPDHLSDNKSSLAYQAEIKQYNIEIKKIKKENELLRKITHHIHAPKFKYISSRVIANNSNIFDQTFMIAAGAVQHVTSGSIVMNEDGFLIGKITNVYDNTATFMTWKHSNFKIPIFLLKSNIHCIAVGNSNADCMELLYLPDHFALPANEIAVTSGEAAVTPFGIPIGDIILNKNSNAVMLAPFSEVQKFGIVTVTMTK